MLPAPSCKALAVSVRSPAVTKGRPRCQAFPYGRASDTCSPYDRVSRMKRERIDTLLVERGLAQSRTRAQALVMAGVVLVDEQLVNKPSEKFDVNANVRLKGDDDPASRYASRGGVKLEAALREVQIDVNRLTCLDVGSSTRRFTDFLLPPCTPRLVALVVRPNQLDWGLCRA